MRILIDFGAVGTPTDNGASPNDPDFFWNNVPPAIGTSSTGTLANLVTSTNAPTTISLAMVSRFNGSNSDGATDSTAYPTNATRDSLFGNTEEFNGLSNILPSFTLTGLDPEVDYDFTFYASRGVVSDNRETTYTVAGATTDSASLNASTNVNSVATVSAMRPTAGGEVTISLAPGTNNNNANHFTYLGVLQIDTVETPEASEESLINVSVRGQVRDGQNIMIAGFVIEGTGTKRVLIRGAGPALEELDVPNVLVDPVMELYLLEDDTSTVIEENDDWGLADNFAEITTVGAALSAFPFAADGADAALLLELPPGRYTANVSGADGATGAALVELYDADIADEDPVTARIINISMRGEVSEGDDVMIAGFVIGGDQPRRVLVRVVGPELEPFGVENVLTDPVLKVFHRISDQQTDEIAENDDWGSDQEEALVAAAVEVQAFALTADSTSAAVILELDPGLYTAHASSGDGTSGIVLVEVYELP